MGASAGASTAVERRGLPELVLPGTEADGGRTSVGTNERMGEKRVASSPRPITFALPPLPSPRLSSTSPQLTPNSEHANPFATSPSSPSSGFLGRLGRKLSLGRRSSRKGAASSERRKSRDVSEQVAPALAVTEEKENVPPSTSPRTARTGVRVQLVDPGPSTSAAPPSPELSRRRSLRVSSALLRRSKSEGSSPSPSSSAAPARRRRSARRGQDRLWTEEEKYAELASRRRAERGEGGGEGGYVWDEGLGLCWDGREMVRPDLLSSTNLPPTEPYTSNSDFLPPSSSLPPAHALSSSTPTPSHRIVYASTLSSFPPRPPLKGKERELTPAERVVREYREKWGWLDPSLKSFRMDHEGEREDQEGERKEEEQEEEEGDLPTPTPSNPLSTEGFPPLSPPPPQPEARTLSRLDPSLPPDLSHTDSPSASPVSPTHASKASTASSSVPSERYGFTSRTRSRGRAERGEGDLSAEREGEGEGEGEGSETSHGTAGDEDEADDEQEGEKRGAGLAVPRDDKMGGSFVTADEGVEDDAVDDWQECE